ncbi:MAG: hypothetical protein J0M29_12070 [Chitinophagales bacterium]|nr:hypothetical protein [Chitinophagales bacterium]
MEFIKRLFQAMKSPGSTWTMFSASKQEVKEMLVSLGQVEIGGDFIKIENYPFEPSIAFRQSIIKAEHIEDIDCKSYPATLRVGDDLIFLSRENIEELEAFAKRNKIELVERPPIWGWILEPFLDTEFTAEANEATIKLLNSYGLTTDQIRSLRAEVETQMLKYNFDTMLWEWGGFDASDVLRAMRTKYKKDQFEDFYKRVMQIACMLSFGINEHEDF